MYTFILYNKLTQEQKEVEVEISPTLVETLDESLDNMTLSLKINEDQYPIKPRINELWFIKNSETIFKFLISADNVELVATNPLRYKHTLSLIQSSQDLTKHLIRNNVFSTSLGLNTKKLYVSKSAIGNGWFKTPLTNYEVVETDASIDLKKIKIIDLKFKINFYFQIPYALSDDSIYTEYIYTYYNTYMAPNKWSDGFQYNQNSNFKNNLPTLYFEIIENGNTYLETWTITNSSFNNGDELQIPSNIFDFIQSHLNGVLRIYIGDISIITDYPSIPGFPKRQELIDYKIPLFINYKVEIELLNIVERSVYQTINQLLVQYQKNTKLYHDADLLFKMPDSNHHPELEELLKNTETPNFVFTQSSMFDALTEIFKLFDATFRIDNDGYLDIEYFNEHEPIELDESDKAGKSSSLGEERLANKMVTYFQNTKIDDRFPNSNDENATAYARSKTLGVPGDSDFVFEVPKPIDIINKVRINCGLFFAKTQLYKLTVVDNTYTYSAEWGQPPSDLGLLDITDNVLEESIWSILPSNPNPRPNETVQQNCFYYKRGEKYINISAYYRDLVDQRQSVLNNVILAGFYKTFGTFANNIIFNEMFNPQYPDWRKVKLSVSYIALIDGKLVNESMDFKAPGEILTNQNNGSIDINKLGLNMVGLSMKLGQPTLNMVQKFTTWDERIKKGQFFIDKNGDKWVANSCSYTLMNNDVVQANIGFVKNFNGLASRIELNREKRLSNISNDLTIKCEDDYGEYVYYCDLSRIDIGDSGEEIHLKDIYVQNTIAMTFNSTLGSINIGSNRISILDRIVDLTDTIDCIAALNSTNGTGKELYYIEGFVGNGETASNQGGIKVHFNFDDDAEQFTGASVYIPLSTVYQGCLKLNELTDEFDYFSYNDFNTHFPTNLLNEDPSFAYSVKMLVLKKNGQIKGAAITEFSGASGFNESNGVWIYQPENTNKIEYALITALNDDNSIITIPTTGEVKNIAIPMVVYGSGNSVCFEMSFDSPISAGNQLLDNYTSIWQAGGYFSRAVIYANTEGEASKFTIDFVKMREPLTHYFPAMKKSDNNEYLDTYSFGKIEEYGYYKKPNEIFALNYQLHFLPRNKIFNKGTISQYNYNAGFLNNEFIKNNAFANGLNQKKFKFVYYTNPDLAYSIFDTKGKQIESEPGDATTIDIKEIFLTTGIHNLEIIFRVELTIEEQNTITSWAIVDENDNIYYCSNNKSSLRVSDDAGYRLTFFWRHHRFED